MSHSAIVLPPSADGLRRVAEALLRGNLCVIPTDTVYGLAAVLAPEPVSRLYVAKGRPEDRPIPLLVSSVASARQVASSWPQPAEALARAFWPGPVTLVVPAADGLPAEVTAGTGTVGVRWPASDLATDVIERTGGVLAVTSANRSGQAPAVSAEEAARTLGDAVRFVLDGGSLAGHLPSTVVAVDGGELRLLREGPISLAELRSAITEFSLSQD